MAVSDTFILLFLVFFAVPFDIVVVLLSWV